MALDLTRILEFADQNGRLCDRPQRSHIVITDGIIGGEGNGPLSPRPVPLGYLSFSENLPAADYVNCLVMGIDPLRLPIVREAFSKHRFPVADDSLYSGVIRVNGALICPDDLRAACQRPFAPPREWRNWNLNGTTCLRHE
jgi:hypothetical protein